MPPPTGVSSLTSIANFSHMLEKYRDAQTEVLVYIHGQQEPFVGHPEGAIDRIVTLRGQPPEDQSQPEILVHLALEAIVALEVHIDQPEPGEDDPDDEVSTETASDADVIDYLAGKPNKAVQRQVDDLAGGK